MICQTDRVEAERQAEGPDAEHLKQEAELHDAARTESRREHGRDTAGDERARGERNQRGAGLQRAEPQRALEVERQYEQQSELAESDDQRGDVAAAEAGDREQPQIDDDEPPGPKPCPLDRAGMRSARAGPARTRLATGEIAPAGQPSSVSRRVEVHQPYVWPSISPNTSAASPTIRVNWPGRSTPRGACGSEVSGTTLEQAEQDG